MNTPNFVSITGHKKPEKDRKTAIREALLDAMETLIRFGVASNNNAPAAMTNLANAYSTLEER